MNERLGSHRFESQRTERREATLVMRQSWWQQGVIGRTDESLTAWRGSHNCEEIKSERPVARGAPEASLTLDKRDLGTFLSPCSRRWRIYGEVRLFVTLFPSLKEKTIQIIKTWGFWWRKRASHLLLKCTGLRNLKPNYIDTAYIDI